MVEERAKKDRERTKRTYRVKWYGEQVHLEGNQIERRPGYGQVHSQE